MSKKDHRKQIEIPSWVSFAYTLFALILVPWVIYLAKSLPHHHPQPHYDVAWVGLDASIMVTLFITAILATKKSSLVVLSASAIGALLLVDAWFDLISSRPGFELTEAISLGIVIEIPLAIASFVLAYKVLSKNSK